MFENFLFISSALLIIGSTLGMVFTRDIIHACVFLLGTLIGVAGLYVTLGADFVAATQIMVYVGGVVILMLFAVMLTGGKEWNKGGFRIIPLMGSKTSYAFGLISALVLVCSSYKIIYKILEYAGNPKNAPYETTVEKLGTLLITDHVLAFEISSVLLLGALVGAAIIARPQKGAN